jgi:hypothetical protein
MRTNLRNKLGMGVLLLVVAALLGPVGAAFGAPLAAPVSIDLCATAGSATMPDGGLVFIFYPNNNGAVKPGDKVTALFHDVRLEPIAAK